jgi:hypothetical protein
LEADRILSHLAAVVNAGGMPDRLYIDTGQLCVQPAPMT